jgi:hypothetical protein
VFEEPTNSCNSEAFEENETLQHDEALMETVRPISEKRTPKNYNPNPKLSWKTWGLIIFLVGAGLFVYAPFLKHAIANVSEFVNVNQVLLPRIIKSKEISRGGVDIVRRGAFNKEMLPSDGDIDGVTYGDPFYMKGGVGQGWFLYSKRQSVDDETQNYLKQVISDWSQDSLTIDSYLIRGNELAVGNAAVSFDQPALMLKGKLYLSFTGVSYMKRAYVFLGLSDEEGKLQMRLELIEVTTDLLDWLDEN